MKSFYTCAHFLFHSIVSPFTSTAEEDVESEEESPDETEELRDALRDSRAVASGLELMNTETAGRLQNARQDLAETRGRLSARTAQLNAALIREGIWRQNALDLNVENNTLRTQMAAAMALASPVLVQQAVGPIADPVAVADLPPVPPPAADDDA